MKRKEKHSNIGMERGVSWEWREGNVRQKEELRERTREDEEEEDGKLKDHSKVSEGREKENGDTRKGKVRGDWECVQI